MSNRSKNPNWEIDELVLALELYMRHRRNLPSADHPDILELSERLKRITPMYAKKHKNFRSPASVYMKLQNFRSLDSIKSRSNGSGLSHVGKLDAVVWESFSGNRRALTTQAEAIVIQRDVLQE